MDWFKYNRDLRHKTNHSQRLKIVRYLIHEFAADFSIVSDHFEMLCIKGIRSLLIKAAIEFRIITQTLMTHTSFPMLLKNQFDFSLKIIFKLLHLFCQFHFCFFAIAIIAIVSFRIFSFLLFRCLKQLSL